MKTVERELGFVPSWLAAQYEMLLPQNRWLRRSLRRRSLDRQLGRTLAVHRELFGQRGVAVTPEYAVWLSSLLWRKTMLPNYILSTLGDRMELAHSVEGRLPYLDHRLVELVDSLPAAVKQRWPVSKYLLRQVGKPFLPDSIFKKPKRPFVAPRYLSTSNAVTELVEDTLASKSLEELPFFRAAWVRSFWDYLRRRPATQRGLAEPLLLEVISLCFLQRLFQPDIR